MQGQLARLHQQATEIERLRAAPPPAVSQSDLRALVQSRIGAGLARALVRIDAPDPDQVDVVFGAVAFAEWLDWIAGLGPDRIGHAHHRPGAWAGAGQHAGLRGGGR